MNVSKTIVYIFLTYSEFFIFGNFIFGRGDYNNAQPAKSSFGFFKFGAGTFWEWPVWEIQALTTITCLIPKRKIQNPAAAAAEFLILLATIIL